MTVDESADRGAVSSYDELPYIRDEVLPRLERMGLR